MNQSRPHSLLVSLLINVVLFSTIVAVGFPIFNSGDDVYLMYLLGGGFGQAPSELLHYNHIMHPYMGLIIKNLFSQFPDFNWYTALLYLIHFISCTVVLWQLLRRNKLVVALITFAIIFFSIEARFLLQPSFTNTALLTATAAALLLYDGKLLAGYILILIATMFRMHMLIPVAIIAAPFFLMNIKKHVHTISIVAIVMILLFLQQQYYKQHIPNWQAEEDYRSAVIHYYNVPKEPIAYTRDSLQYAAELIEFGQLWDKTWLSAQKISAVTKKMRLGIASDGLDFGQRLYWLFVENRLALLVFLGFFIYRFSFMNKREKLVVIASTVLLFGLCLGLLLFRKLPPYVIPGGLFVWFAFTGLTGTHPTNTSSKRNWIFAIGAVLLIAWSIARIVKLNSWNKRQHQQFACAHKQVAAAPNKLFIASDDRFPMDFFHVWHTPHQYSLPNILYKDHFLNNTYQPVYKRFNISSASEFVDSKTVLFIGSTPNIPSDFFELQFGQPVRERLMKNPPGCNHIWQLVRFPLTQPLSPDE